MYTAQGVPHEIMCCRGSGRALALVRLLSPSFRNCEARKDKNKETYIEADGLGQRHDYPERPVCKHRAGAESAWLEYVWCGYI